MIGSTYLAACIPSHVEANLINIRSLPNPASSYREINFLALEIEPSLSNDSLKKY